NTQVLLPAFSARTRGGSTRRESTRRESTRGESTRGGISEASSAQAQPPSWRASPASASTIGKSPRAWHALDAKEVLLAVGSSMRRGLSDGAVKRRQQINGPNRLEPPARRSALAMFIGQFKSLPVALLGGSAVASIATGGLVDALVILGVVLINGVIGYVTESQTERAIDALNDTGPRHALVLRNAALQRVDASELVVGDILVLGNGAYVHADARLLEARQLSVDESALTGESLPASKSHERSARIEVALAERNSMVYMGTSVVSGSALAVVVATGMATELGTIQSLVGSTRPPATPMQRQLERFGNQTVRLASAVCALVFALGLVRGLGLLAMFKASVSLAVAAVPEGLPTVATTTLALGIRRMRDRKVLVRRLDAVETLGAVHTVCFDKTGTLTFNRMRVLALHAGHERKAVVDGFVYAREGRVNPFEHDDLLRLLHVAVLCNEVELSGGPQRYALNGSSTETALVEFALAAGVDVNALRARHPVLHTAHRADERNYMCTLHRMAEPDGHLVAVKGNPVEVLALCSTHAHDGERAPLTEAHRQAILEANREMAADALRMLGFAYASGDETLGVDARNLCWLGMLGLADPIRHGAKELVALLRAADIKTAIVTGDQGETARAVARMLDLHESGEPQVVQPSANSDLTDAQFARLAHDTDIFARVSAANKLRIVRGLQHGGDVVAMVGDGINDGPALKAANISVAMGRHGTELAREVADVVLEDDNLETLAVAISQGRTIYNNIRKSVHFLVSTNVSEILVTLAAVGAGVGQPLTPMQLLWINLLTDVFPALALAVEPPEPDVLQRPPRSAAEPIVARSDMMRYGREALVIGAGALASHTFAAARHGAGAAAGTVSFMTLTLGQLLHAYSCRSDAGGTLNILSKPRNRHLDLAIGGSMALQLVACAIPGLASLLGLTRIDALDALAVAAGAATPYLINEGLKPARVPTTASRTGR
ncbi:MAG TPA: cation-transporting P-type ATPase, partial [Trinickia sp.]|nr:cation-transporting P-type ATPase [Trinickia sp.]